MKLRVLALDDGLDGQPCLEEAIASGKATRIDLRELGQGMRVIASRRKIDDFIGRLDCALGPHGDEPEMFFYGSGDFHHLSAALVRRCRRPLTIIQFDNHPDWCRFPPTYNCGGWINRVLTFGHVERVITLGPTGSDLAHPQLQGANLAAIAAGRLEVYPWQAPPSRVWGRFADSPCWRWRAGHLEWRTLAQERWNAFLDALIARLPDTALWITIDKDVLSPDEATTNWDQGAMPLTHVLSALEYLAASRPIAGIDVCGDYSTPQFRHPLRRLIANFDNPPRERPEPAALALNAAANARLIETSFALPTPAKARA